MHYRFKDYTPHYKNIFSLGLPIVAGQVGTIVLGFADTLMVGHHSVVELAAASFVNTLMAIVLILALGFSYGLTPMIGHAYAQDDTMLIGKLLRNAWAAAMVVALVLVVALMVAFRFVADMGQPEELLPYIRPYLIINIVSVPFACGFNTMKQFFDAIGSTSTSMYIMIGGNVANIVGNWLLIYGVGGLPEMGLTGAGLSTLFSRILIMAVAIAVFGWSSRYCNFARAFLRSRLERFTFNRICIIGMPVSLQMGMESAAFALTGIMVGWIGTTALATHQIALTISQLFYMVYYGIAAAVAVRVSHYSGMGQRRPMRTVAAAGFHIIVAIGCVISVPMIFLHDTIGWLFTDSDEVTAMVGQIILLMIVYQFGDGLQCNYANALRGTQNVKPAIFISFFSYFVVSLPLSWLLGIHLQFGIMGIWAAFPVSLSIAGVLYYHYFRKTVNQD